MKNSLLLVLSSIFLAFGISACKSGGGHKSGPASAPATMAQASAPSDPGAASANQEVHASPAAPASEALSVFAAPPAVGTKAKCAVSGETFVVDGETKRAEHDGKHFAFCCDGCADDFTADPGKFAQK